MKKEDCEKKKIVHLVLTDSFNDGWNYQENILAKYHRKLGFSVTLIASIYVCDMNGNETREEEKSYINEDGVKIVRIYEKRSHIYKRISIYPNLKDVLKQENPFIIFVHNFQFFSIKDVYQYQKENECRLYIDNHADLLNSGRNWLSLNVLHKMIWRFIAKKINVNVKCFYGVLPARVDFLTNIYQLPPQKCKLLLLGADDEKIEETVRTNSRQLIRKEYDVNDNEFLIVTGGKINKWRPQTLDLMKAVKNINQINVKLIIFGSISNELKTNFNLLLVDKLIQYIGWCEAPDTYKLFSAADLVVFPGMHSVFWEQVAGQGIPMVVHKWNGVEHIDLGGNVKFITEDGVSQLQGVLEQIINNPKQYEKMKKIAMEKGKEKFSYLNIAKRSIEIL